MIKSTNDLFIDKSFISENTIWFEFVKEHCFENCAKIVALFTEKYPSLFIILVIIKKFMKFMKFLKMIHQ